jgi:hypothetical protein
MAQYQHLPIYKATYDLLLRVTEVTRHFPRDFKTFATRVREDVVEVVLLIYHANSRRAERATLLGVIVERMQAVELALRLAKDLRLMSVRQFSSVVILTDSVIRQASGWQKSAVSAE